jgi:GAF domain-containing protein
MHQQTIITPFLESILTSSGADGAYVYHFETGGAAAQLAAWAGPPPDPQYTSVEGRIAREHFERESPLVLHDEAWSDRRFAAFPEFSVQLFAGVVSVPLTHSNTRTGLLNVCRLQPASLAAGEAAFLFGLNLPLGALLASTTENQKLSEQLADRKLFDRAKGVLQARFGWTEEQAYLHLRRTSRQRRTAMREIATDVIERGDLHVVQARRAS